MPTRTPCFHLKKRGFLIAILFIVLALVVFFDQANLLSKKFRVHTNTLELYRLNGKKPSRFIARIWMVYAFSITQYQLSAAQAARYYAYVASIYSDVLEKTGDPMQASIATSQLISTLTPSSAQNSGQILQAIYKTFNITQKDPLLEDGKKILDSYKLRASNDNFNLTWDKKTPQKAHSWYIRSKEIDPSARAGDWKTWIVKTNIQVPPPPPIGSLEDSTELKKMFYLTEKRKGQEDIEPILFWDNAEGLRYGEKKDDTTLAAVWQNILFTEMGDALHEQDYAYIQKVLAQTIADSYIYAWRVKYFYWRQRPSMRIPNLKIALFDPSNPSYVSDHATVSTAAKTVLDNFFPDKQSVWRETSEDSENSRLVAGLDFDSDVQGGNYLGEIVGQQVLIALHRLSSPSTVEYQRDNILKTVLTYGMISIFEQINSIKSITGTTFQYIKKNLFRSLPKEIFFTDVTDTVGLIQNAPFATLSSLDTAHSFTGGVAVGDYNNDGFQDVYLVSDKKNYFFQNNKGRFKQILPTGLTALAQDTERSGPLFANLLGDGQLDLFIGGIGTSKPKIFKNNGDGTFQDASTGLAAVSLPSVYSAAAGDYDKDGNLDLFLASWAQEVIPQQITSLLHNRGGGVFEDVTKPAGIDISAQSLERKNKKEIESITSITEKGIATVFTPNFADIDDDGWPDLLLAADFGRSQVFVNNKNGAFKETTNAVINDENGMGAAIGDFENRGRQDWFVTGIYDEKHEAQVNNPGAGASGNRLYKNQGDGTFEDGTDKAGVRNGYWGWGTCTQDFDNDGYLDIFEANGYVTQPPSLFTDDPAVLFMNNGNGTFTEKAYELGIDDRGQGRAVSCFDYDNNGTIDVLLTNKGGKAKLFKNTQNVKNNFLNVTLRYNNKNLEAIGAKIYIKTKGLTQMRELRSGSNFESQDPAIAHFGLGKSSSVDVLIVVWPNGERTKEQNVKANQFLTIRHQ